MKRLLLTLLIAALFFPLEIAAQSFTYNYKGVDFKCKVKDGKAIIKGFNRDVVQVLIPSQVKDKRGRTYQVNVVDLFDEFCTYKTNTVVIEQGITEIGSLCFFYFDNLATIYIPNTISRIGKEAFNSKHLPTFNMPSNIKESDLRAGLTVYPRTMESTVADPMSGLDLSAYSDTPIGESAEDTPQETVAASKTVAITPGTSDIDLRIPTGNVQRENTFCVIIANENYKAKDTPNVKYAAQDGKTFSKYCQSTLGLPKENIRFVANASYLQMRDLLKWMSEIGTEYGKDANFIVYYAGHGVPDEKGNCKLIPADVSINAVDYGFSLKELYSSLGKITTSNVLVLIDACFSGNDRGDVAALNEQHRGIVREVKNEVVSGNVVVLTAASGTETALSYDEKGHGLFSYYLMKKLQETKGNVSFGELYDYVKKEVARKSIVVMSKKQTPSLSVSGKLTNNWKNLKF